jgi:hypothetical protein
MSGGPVPHVEVGQRADLVEVHLLRLPLATHRAASEHADELRREFTLIRAQQADDDAADVPRRLVALMEELEEQFSGYSDDTRVELDEAMERGEGSIDLVFRVPPEAGEAAVRLGAMLDEADAHCRKGDALLTLATAPDALAYRRWYLEEFTRQLDGLPPRPWTGS